MLISSPPLRPLFQARLQSKNRARPFRRTSHRHGHRSGLDHDDVIRPPAARDMNFRAERASRPASPGDARLAGPAIEPAFANPGHSPRGPAAGGWRRPATQPVITARPNIGVDGRAFRRVQRYLVIALGKGGADCRNIGDSPLGDQHSPALPARRGDNDGQAFASEIDRVADARGTGQLPTPTPTGGRNRPGPGISWPIRNPRPLRWGWRARSGRHPAMCPARGPEPASGPCRSNRRP